MIDIAEEHYEDVRKNLISRFNLAHSYHDLLAAFTGKGLLPHYADELNRCPTLMRILEKGIKQAFVITLCSFYDRDSRSVTFSTFESILKEQGKLPAQWDTEFEPVKKLIERLQLLRNKHYAHDSKQKLTRDIFTESAMTYNLVTEIFEASRELISKLLFADDGTDYQNNDSLKDDIGRLFRNYDPDGVWEQGPR